MEKICAGIVLYNPDLDRLKANVDAISCQVEKVIIVDNGSSNVEDVKLLLANYSNLIIIYNQENLGIAKALNQILETAKSNGFEWALTLDQDSVCPEKMIERMYPYADMEKVGIVCPRFLNTVEIKEQEKALPETEEIEMCITSGSLTNISAWEKSGKFDDWMFIDCVDYDICLKLRQNGYSILRVNDVVIDHCVGSGKKVKFLGLFPTVVYNHSKMRNYYFVRNYVYIIRKYKKMIKPFKRKMYVLHWELKKFFLEPHKMDTLKSFFKGLKDGKKIKINSKENNG